MGKYAAEPSRSGKSTLHSMYMKKWQSNTARSIIFYLTLVMIVLVAYSRLATLFLPDHTMAVYVDGELYYDDSLTEDFDYSLFLNKEISFSEKVNIPSWVGEGEQVIRIESIEEFWKFIDLMDMPNVVKGMAKLIADDSHDMHLSMVLGDPGCITYRIYRGISEIDLTESFRLERWYGGAGRQDSTLYWFLSLNYGSYEHYVHIRILYN